MESIKDIFTIFVTLIGLVCAAFWFFKRRRFLPKANIEHSFKVQPLLDSKILLRVTAIVENCGEVLIGFEEYETRIHILNPLPAHELNIIQEININTTPKDGILNISDPIENIRKTPIEIEPDEIHEVHFDFIIDDSIRSIVAYTSFKNIVKTKWFIRKLFNAKNQMSWIKESIFEIPQIKGEANHGKEE